MQIPEVTRVILALQQIPAMGAQRIRLLLGQVEEPAQVFSLGRKRLQKLNGFGDKIINSILGFDNWQDIDEILKKTEQLNARLVSWFDEDYPPLLRETGDPPLLLWVLGDVSNLKKDGIAVIGTRKPGKYGQLVAQQFTKELVAHNAVVTSGLAYGIDTIAHRAAVDAGGKTIAVLGSGIDWIYPAANKKLANDILENGGTIISEFLPGSKPDAGNFPVRNRIVSGLSRGVLVIESGMEGGSMITARIALEQNREVFAVPHHIQYPGGSGCNRLIRDGHAKLVQTADDIFSEMSLSGFFESAANEQRVKPHPNWRVQKDDLDELAISICELLEEESLHIDKLSEKLGKRPDELAVALLELEFKGCLKPLAGKMFAIS